jgi:formylglycine-generating enzyme required for sulfatase activity
MLDLNGSQLKVLRTGLQSAFVGPDALDVFLREDLDKRLNFYAGSEDPFPIAAFKLIEGAQAEGWIDELVTKAYQARPKNQNVADIAKALGVTIDISKLEPTGPVHPQPPLWQNLNPYRGLLALREQDANFLFGRDEDITRFIATLAENPSKLFLALGASGVGKSSLIFAGVFAALDRQSLRGGKPWPAQLSQSRSWPRLALTPGPEPLRGLAGAFVRQWLNPVEAKFREETNDWRNLFLNGDSLDGLIEALDAFLLKEKGDKPLRYLLYIDQGEELYTRGGREPSQDNTSKETQAQKEARRFSEVVAAAARHPRIVAIMSARSDFLGRLQADAPLLGVKQQIDIAPLSPEGLAEVVRRPAAALDVSFEAGLDDALIESTRGQAGGLPLLSDTLDTLWKEMQARGDGVLRWSRPIKEEVDVALKLGERADGFVNAHQEQEALIRRLFCVRLAYVPLQGAATRRTAFLEELSEPERALVSELAGPEQRIVVTGERDGKAIAEVAHEALFTAWQTLRNWIVSRRAFYAWVTQNEADRQDFEKQGKPSSGLLTGRPLERAKTFLETNREDLPDPNKEFIAQSIAREEKAQARARFVRAGIYGLGAVVILGLVGWINQSYVKEQMDWYMTMRPYRVANVDPYVLKPEVERALKPLASFRECAKDCPEMVVIPAGEFMMGLPNAETSRFKDEGPQHKVTIPRPFAVSKFDVTFGDWDACASVGGCPRIGYADFGRGTMPVINVVWDDAQKYVAWLSKMTGQPYRLLTEAEWEYAARAGSSTAYFWGDQIGTDNANCYGCGSQWDVRQTSPVGSFKPNAFGLYDMVGNVWQWVQDCYHDGYTEAHPKDGAAWTTDDCSQRVARGGAWLSNTYKLRSSFRDGLIPGFRVNYLGFRLGRTLTP